MAAIAQHTADIGGRPVFWHSAPPAAGAEAPVLYLHGNPTSSDDFLVFLERTGGLAPDLPGFGRSGKRGDGDYTMGGYDRFVEAFLDHVEAERVQLLVHGWGSSGLLWAQRFPERVQRVVVVNAVPLLPGYRWHRIARLWRTPVVGELLMGMTTRWSLGRASRRFNAAPGPMSADFLDRVWAHWDQGTQRAVLQLYRASPETALAAAGARLGAVTCPALVVWGERDPFLPARFADAYAAALGGPVRLARLPDAGHWPWLDRPDVIDAVTAFFTGGEPPAGFA